MMSEYHVPVLKEEVLRYLDLPGRRLVVDGTLGDGGHSELILEHADKDCLVLGIDRDEEAIERARARLSPYGDRMMFAYGNHSDLPAILKRFGFEKIDALLLDLGVSTAQLLTPRRGFSIMHDAPLDMRQDLREKTTAADLLANLSDSELESIFRDLGGEHQYKKIVRFIREAQSHAPVLTTSQLSSILASAVRRPHSTKIHPASKSFLALRLAVNNEIGHLRQALEASLPHLQTGARMVVISFFSDEDREVKNFFQKQELRCVCPPKLPICSCDMKPTLKRVVKKSILPTEGEVRANPRSRSARLRVAEKVDG